jgi:TRAP-type mannitol/chloroaromatic compound transport system permease small subunit
LQALEIFIRIVERINKLIGNVVAIAIPAIMVLLTLEVILRYLFNNPTTWAMEISQMLMCFFVALGGGYTAIKGNHVNVDILVSKLSERNRSILSIATAPLFFIFTGLFLAKITEIAWQSMEVLETSGSFFDPPVYPIKIMMAFGVLFLFLQGLSNLIKDFYFAINGVKIDSTAQKEGSS